MIIIINNENEKDKTNEDGEDNDDDDDAGRLISVGKIWSNCDSLDQLLNEGDLGLLYYLKLNKVYHYLMMDLKNL